jgi:hypothetical protein
VAPVPGRFKIGEVLKKTHKRIRIDFALFKLNGIRGHLLAPRKDCDASF